MRGAAARILILLGLAAASVRGEVVTLPAVASLQGGNPFFSDVRVFNTSYSSSLEVTATYRCFIATVACPASPPQIQFTLAPRESRAFDDMVASADGFNAHDTAGGVEFETTEADGPLLVTSRLFSTSPLNSVGMFIPGLHADKAFPISVLTSIRHDPQNSFQGGFRTNVGAFNPGDADVLAQFSIFTAGAQIGGLVTRNVPAHSGVQVTRVFEAAGVGAIATENASIVVASGLPLFTYAAVLDNRTADPIFVVGARDRTAGAVTPTPTGTSPTLTATPGTGPSPTITKTPGGVVSHTPTRTRTSTPIAPTATPPGPSPTLTATAPGVTTTPTATRTPTSSPTQTTTPSGTVHDVTIGPGMSFNPATVNIAVGDSVKWTWTGGLMHSTTQGSCPGGVCSPAPGGWDSGKKSSGTFTQSFPSGGSFSYYCRQHLSAMQGTVNVGP